MSQRGYHLRDISPKGEPGSLNKVLEELDELKEAMEQENPIMALVEASDVALALEQYIQANIAEEIGMADLFAMAEATKRAFESGERK